MQSLNTTLLSGKKTMAKGIVLRGHGNICHFLGWQKCVSHHWYFKIVFIYRFVWCTHRSASEYTHTHIKIIHIICLQIEVQSYFWDTESFTNPPPLPEQRPKQAPAATGDEGRGQGGASHSDSAGRRALGQKQSCVDGRSLTLF